MSGASSRVSIPNNVKKTIQNIKEIAKNHSDDEIYAMLKECSMDPNETVQKLLHQDTFHEVRRKRDKRKENVNNKDTADSRWRSGTQGRGGRGGRGNYSSRYASHDAGGGRAATAGKENGVKQGTERGVTPTSMSPSQETENKATTLPSSSVTPTVVEPTNATYGHGSAPAGHRTNHPVDGSEADANKFETVLPPPVNIEIVESRVRAGAVAALHKVGSEQKIVDSNTVVPFESKSSASQNVGDHHQAEKPISHDVTNTQLSSSMNEKAASDIGNSFMHEKMPSKSQGVEKTQVLESPQPSSSSTHGGSSTGRPSSNYGNRPQQLIGSQKAVGPIKEWKPKPTTPNPSLVPVTIGTSEVGTRRAEAGAESLPTVSASSSEPATSKLQKKPEELHFSPGQHVIIPDHLQVPEAERCGLSFGSFDASFGVRTSYGDSPDSDKSSTPLSESSIEEAAEDPSSSNQNASQDSPEGDYHHHPQSPRKMPENSSSGDVESSGTEYYHSKPEMVLPPAGSHYSVVHTAPTYSSFGLMPPMLGTQFASFDSSEPQARDVSRLPGFVVQPPFDPSTSYYTQLYRSGADGDGRISPFLPSGAPSKYNGNISVLSQQSSQSPQESGNSQVLSTAGPTPLVTQASGVMPSSIAMTQPPVPVFRQPAGVHISHYPPNFIPYNQFFSPFYVQPPGIHHFLGNPTFPQQPPTGSVYPSPAAAAAAAATGVKYSFPHFKPGTNTGNTTHIGMPTGYGPYSSSSAGYGPSPATTAANSTGNEDRAASQCKENNVYIAGQQSESSAVWVPAPSRDISGLQANSFYNPQGQHVTFPTQSGHGAFAGMYHPAQTVSAATVHPLLQPPQTMAGGVEIVGPPSGIYQQPQRAQINWTNNY